MANFRPKQSSVMLLSMLFISNLSEKVDGEKNHILV